MFDELEPLGGHGGCVSSDVPQVGQDLVVRASVRVSKDGGVAGTRGQRPARHGDGIGQLGRLAGGDRIGRQRQAGPVVQLDQEVDLVGGRHGEPEAKVRQALADQAVRAY